MGDEYGIISDTTGVKTAPTIKRCRYCPNYHAYVNAKLGLGLCTYFMHEMPVDGYCSEWGKEGR